MAFTYVNPKKEQSSHGLSYQNFCRTALHWVRSLQLQDQAFHQLAELLAKRSGTADSHAGSLLPALKDGRLGGAICPSSLTNEVVRKQYGIANALWNLLRRM